MYKYSTDYLPTLFNAYFSNQSQIHNRNTANVANNNLAIHRTNFASKVSTHPDQVWNSLLKEIKLSINVKIFRKQLRNNIFSTQYYNINFVSAVLFFFRSFVCFSMFFGLDVCRGACVWGVCCYLVCNMFVSVSWWLFRGG